MKKTSSKVVSFCMAMILAFSSLPEMAVLAEEATVSPTAAENGGGV